MNSNRNITMAFTAEQISRLAGISVGRLRYWEKTDAFIPEKFKRIVSGPFSRIYTFQDLVSLRVIAALRLNHDIELQQLRNVSNYINHHSAFPWSSLAIRLAGKIVEFRDPETGKWVSANPLGQFSLEIEFEDVRASAESDARTSMQRGQSQVGNIVRNRNVMSNQFVFEGTRIPVATVLRFLDAGYKTNDILRSYPTLSVGDVDAARQFAKREFDVA